MSFSSALPTPQTLLKSGAAAAPPPPPLTSSDAAVGADTLVALLATLAAADAASAADAAIPVVAAVHPLPEVGGGWDAASPVAAAVHPPPEAGRGRELVAEQPVRLPPEVDVGRPLDLLVRAGPRVFERVLRFVRRGDLILPGDQNELVYAWRDVVEGLQWGRRGMQLEKPEALQDYDRYAQRVEDLVRAMPVVKEGDWVYAEHFNLHLRALRAMIEMRRWLASQVFPELPSVEKPADRAEQLLLFTWEKGSGDVVLSADWNAVRQAFSALYAQVGYVERPGALLPKEALAKQPEVLVWRRVLLRPLRRPDVMVLKPIELQTPEQPGVTVWKLSRTVEVKPG